MSIETYNPKDISVVIGGFVLSGFADDKVRVFREADAWDDEVGCDGDVVRFASNDKRGEIEITLLQTSSSNLTLSTLAKTDELSGAGTFPAIVQDSRGSDLHVAATAWVKKIPEAKYRKGVVSRVWRIRTDNLQTFLGGA
jgi:hypothetical protein